MKGNKYIHILFLVLFLISLCRAGEWEVIGQMPLPVNGGEALVLDSLIYIFGGYSDSLREPVDWIQAYRPTTDQWYMVGHMSLPRYGFVADRLGDSLVVFCGGIWSNTPDDYGLELWNYRRRSNNWNLATEKNINFDRIYMTGHVYKNSLYIFGGLMAPAQNDSTNLSFIIRYDIFSATLSTYPGEVYTNVPLPYHHMSVRLDSVVYLIGGVRFNLSDKIMKYDLELNTLEPAGSLQGVCAGGQAVTDSNWIYIIGGYNERSSALNQVEYFDPNSNTSYPGPSLNYSRKECMAVIYDKCIYVFGGKDQNDINSPWIEKLALTGTTASDRVNDRGISAARYHLYDNYPDPFNASTVISFDLDSQTYLTLDIYSITGQHIQTLAQGEFLPGFYRLVWDGRDKNHNAVASNVYIYQIRAENFVQAKKMVLLK
jgi:hypothetical protein